eukprot:1336610-Rhodomonas_salina.4
MGSRSADQSETPARFWEDPVSPTEETAHDQHHTHTHTQTFASPERSNKQTTRHAPTDSRQRPDFLDALGRRIEVGDDGEVLRRPRRRVPLLELGCLLLLSLLLRQCRRSPEIAGDRTACA